MSAIHRRGVLLDGIGAELVRASTGGARKTLSKWLGDILAADTALDTRIDALEAGGAAFADVASAGTVDLGAQSSDKLRITGTTTITSFGTAAAGTRKKLRFAAALTLTYNATSLILPGDASITTAADDYCEAVSLGSGNWYVGAYQRGAYPPATNSTAMNAVTSATTLDAAAVAFLASHWKIKGTQASYEVMNNANTQNWYFGVNDSDANKLYIGIGTGPSQGLVPSITVHPTSLLVSIGDASPPGGVLSVTSNDDYGQNDWVFWTRRSGASGGGAESLWRNQHFGAAGPQPILAFMGARGSEASPAAIQSGDLLASVEARGYDGSSADYTEYALGWSDTRGAFQIYAAGNWSGSSHPTYLDFFTTATSAIVPSRRMRIAAGGEVMIDTTTSGGGIMTVRRGFNVIQGGSDGLGALQIMDQLAGGPSLTFAADTDTGVLRPGDNVMQFNTGGSESFRISAAQDVVLASGKRVDFQNSQTTVGAAGGASALPATPTGYIPIKVGGNVFVVPYYAAS